MRRVILIATFVVALALGIGIGWYIWHDPKVDFRDDTLVTRLRTERDSLLSVVAEREVAVTAWKDSVSLRDQRVVRADSINASLRNRMNRYEETVRMFTGTDDDLHRELNRVIHSGAGRGGSDPAPRRP